MLSTRETKGESERERERASVREGWCGYKDQDIHINTYGNII